MRNLEGLNQKLEADIEGDLEVVLEVDLEVQHKIIKIGRELIKKVTLTSSTINTKQIKGAKNKIHERSPTKQMEITRAIRRKTQQVKQLSN